MGRSMNPGEANDLLTGNHASVVEAELAGMARMLSLVVNSDKRDFPTIVGRMRRVIEAAREAAIQH